MSGYESRGQVCREIESPKALNLQKAALVVGGSAKFTGAQMALTLGADWDRLEKEPVLREPEAPSPPRP